MRLGDLKPGDVFRITEPRSTFKFWEDEDVFMVAYGHCSLWEPDDIEFIDRFGIDLRLPKNTSVELSNDDASFRGMNEVIDNKVRRKRDA